MHAETYGKNANIEIQKFARRDEIASENELL